jgi:O-antigen ligase
MAHRLGALEDISEHLWMLVPGVLVLFLGFDAGGYFAGTAGLAAAGLAVLTAVRLLTARRPLSGLGPTGWTAVGGGAALAVLTLLSAIWSHSFSRALLAFDLVVIYVALVMLAGSVAHTDGRRRTLLYGLLAAQTVVCAAGLLSRVLPQSFPVTGVSYVARLSYPVGYWNALGMMAAIGLLMAGHLSAERRVPVALRALGAALVPMFAATLLLTFSRGAIAALIAALVLYILLSPRLSVLAALIACAPFTAWALITTYNANLLSTRHPTTPAAVGQGHHVVDILILAMLGAAVLRFLLALAEERVPEWDPDPHARRGLSASMIGLVVLAVLVLIGSGWVSREYNGFTHGVVVPSGTSARVRLSSASNNGRLALWRVALHDFSAHPGRGSGAGTYVLVWERRRPSPTSVQNAHSLYLETLAELGVLGAAALVVFLLGLLIRPLRALWLDVDRPMAALAAAGLTGGLLHAAVDWDWQVPVVLAPVLALAAACGPALADEVPPAFIDRMPAWGMGTARALGALGALIVAFLPARVAISQAHLDSSLQAFDRGNCPAAISEARSARGAAPERPQPLELIAYCQAAERKSAPSIATIHEAISQDPGDWEYHFALGIVQAEASQNPLRALRTAHSLDPHEPVVLEALRTLRRKPRTQLRRAALSLPLDVP